MLLFVVAFVGGDSKGGIVVDGNTGGVDVDLGRDGEGKISVF